MSYDISLKLNGETVIVESHMEGGTYAIGGTELADLNITWNYSQFYYQHLNNKKGIRWLYGKQAKKTIKELETAISILGTEQDEDYWKGTPGNAGYALNILLKWAKQHPEAMWDSD